MAKNYWVQLLTAIVLLLVTGFGNPFEERPTTGFWAMPGTVITHPFPDKLDSLSGREIYELRDEKGVPLWFCRHIFKDVCMTGQCKMIRLWLFWDGAGNYLGIQVPENEPLTKSDHTEFEAPDYQKLDLILRDTASVLKTLKSEDLIVEDESKEQPQVDGYTSATQPALKEVVVKDAVYTCHTLWHTVYGHTRHEILTLLESRASEEYLDLLFATNEPAYQSWAITYITKNDRYHQRFYPQIVSLIRSENNELAEQALRYFQNPQLSDPQVQKALVEAFPHLGAAFKYDIIWKFTSLPKTDPGVVADLLGLFEQQKIGVGSLNLIYRLVKPEYLEDTRIMASLNRLAADQNAYIRNITTRLLAK